MEKYELKTISDLVKIPPDRLSEAIKEIEVVIIGYHLQIVKGDDGAIRVHLFCFQEEVHK